MTTTMSIAAGTYNADPVHSSVQSGALHMGVGAFRTSFADVAARLTAGDDGLRLEGRAQVSSISIHNPPEFREHVVNGADFFDASNHPEIVFESSSIDLKADGAVELDGELVIKGIAKPLTATGTWHAPVEDPYGGMRTALELRAIIDRRDWDIMWQAPLPGGSDALGWDVTLDVQLELVKDAG